MLTGSTAHPTVRCAVWGSPIEHSLSPVLHRAAYAALGLQGWTYDRRDVDALGFPAAIAALDETWRGLSLTMPLKEVARAATSEQGLTARATGAINTMVRASSGWTGHNTDVHGIIAALAESGCRSPRSATIIGSGATARSAVRALEEAGAASVTFMVRGEARPETVAQARAAGLRVEVVGLGAWAGAGPGDVVISTVPPEAVGDLESVPAAQAQAGRPVLLDVVYGSGESPLQHMARRQGWTVVPGTAMLLHQAGEQVRLMTGRPAPLEQMRQALAAARP